MREHYLFKIKEDRVTLTKRQGDRIENKFTKDLNTAKVLEQLIIDSSNEHFSISFLHGYYPFNFFSKYCLATENGR